MNEHERTGSRPTSVFLVGLMLAAFVGCTAENPSPPVKAFGDPSKEVPVVITLKMEGEKPVGIDRVDPDPVVLKKGDKQTAHWILNPQIDAKLEIQMKDGTKPFKDHPKSYGKHALSDPPESGEPGKEYRYTIIVTLKDGTKLTLDPVIRVVP